MGAATGAGSLVGGFAVVAVIVGSVALGVAPTVDATETPPPPGAAQQEGTAATDDAEPEPTDPDAEDDVIDGALEGDTETIVDVVEDTVDSVVDTITDDDGTVVEADISLHLTGTGTPGATVTARAAGNVYATVTVNASGKFVVDIAAFPGGLSSIELVQAVDRDYLSDLVLDDNPLADTLGLLDGLIDALVKPLGLSSGGGAVAVHLVG
jgi:hypothetical protein